MAKSKTRRNHSPAFKAAVVSELIEATEQLGSSNQAARAVANKHNLNVSLPPRWRAEAEAAPPKPAQPKYANIRYDEAFKAMVVAEIDSSMAEGPGLWSRISRKYNVHNTTLRDWYRAARGAPKYDPETGHRTRGVRGELATLQPPPAPAPQREFHQEHVQQPQVRWQMSQAAPDAHEYLARRVEELEAEIRVLKAEKVVLMQALNLINPHKVTG